MLKVKAAPPLPPLDRQPPREPGAPRQQRESAFPIAGTEQSPLTDLIDLLHKSLSQRGNSGHFLTTNSEIHAGFKL